MVYLANLTEYQGVGLVRPQPPLEKYRVEGNTAEEKFSFVEGLHETSRLHILALHNKCVEMRTGVYRTSNPEYDENIKMVPKSLYAKYCLVKTALDETIQGNSVY